MINKCILIGIKEYKYSNLSKLDGIYYDINNMEKLVRKLSNNKVEIIKIIDNGVNFRTNKKKTYLIILKIYL